MRSTPSARACCITYSSSRVPIPWPRYSGCTMKSSNKAALPLTASLSSLLRALSAAAGGEGVVRRALGPGEAALEVGVDRPSRLRRGGPRRNGPGAHLLRTGGKVGVQPEQLVRGADHAVEPRLVHAHVLEEQLLVLLRHVGDLRFDGSADRHHRRSFPCRIRFHLLEEFP